MLESHSLYYLKQSGPYTLHRLIVAVEVTISAIFYLLRSSDFLIGISVGKLW